MRFLPTPVEGCRIVELEPIGDDRGFFARAWCSDEMAKQGLSDRVAQINQARTAEPGTVRGLHWRPDPHPEAKFVRCIAGRIFDVCVDVRRSSPTFGRVATVELTPGNRLALAVPEGCAHGYQTLEPDTEVLYLASAPYVPGVEIGARWNDPAFGIEWPIEDGVRVSDRDGSWPDFEARRGEQSE